MNILAVGDIHTKTWIIDLVENVIDDYDNVIFCGDYADDWDTPAEKSIETWQYLYDFAQKYPHKVKAVRGNHDYIYTVHTPTLQSGYNHVTQMLIDKPENKELKDWLTSLPIVLKYEGVAYSHAGIDVAWNGRLDVDSLWYDRSPIWTRPDWADYEDVPQVVGHTPQQTCTEVKPHIWLIDTFSTHHDGSPIGDGTMLEIIDGKQFNKIKIYANNNNLTSLQDPVSRQNPTFSTEPNS